MEEIWKPIKGYEGLYEVSNLGNVRSLQWGNTKEIKNLYLKQHNKGYYHVVLVKNGKKKAFLVHRLVAIAFIDNPNGYSIVNHKDENKRNNVIENLEWCTKSYNVRYSLNLHARPCGIKRKSMCRRKGSQTGKTIIQKTMDDRIVQVWEDARTIFQKTNMSDWSISECCRGKRKTAYGYKWQYVIEDNSGKEAAI